MKSMNGHVINGTSICVDFWPKTPLKHYFHFLTHLHADHTYNLTSSFSEFIYTSPFNAWLVKRWFNIKPELVKMLTIGDNHVLYDDKNDMYFSVTPLNANHCPGSVMFLFQGRFGNILYTGDFRYNPDVLEHPMLKSVVESNALNKLYLDNTFAAEHCEFPPRQGVLKDVLDLIRGHPDHHIIIGIRKLGKEEVIRAIALELKEKVWVPKERLMVLTYLQYEDVFTTDMSESRIFVKEIHQLNSQYVHRLQEEKGPVLTILLTALYSVMPVGSSVVSKLKDVSGVYYLPYSDHSCHSELVKFVSALKPETIYPIVVNKYDFTCNDQQQPDLFDFPSLSSTWNNSVIPESILKFSKNSLAVEEYLEDQFTLEVSTCKVPALQTDALRGGNQDTDSSQVTEDKSREGSHLLSDINKSNKFQKGMEDLRISKSDQRYLNTSCKEDALNACLADSTTFVEEEEEYIPLSYDDSTQLANAVLDNCKNIGINNKSPLTSKVPGNSQNSEVDNESPFTNEAPDNSQNIDADNESPRPSEVPDNSQNSEVDNKSPFTNEAPDNSQNIDADNESPRPSEVPDNSQNSEVDNESPLTNEVPDNSQNSKVENKFPLTSAAPDSSQSSEVDNESPHTSEVPGNSQNSEVDNESPQISEVIYNSQNSKVGNYEALPGTSEVMEKNRVMSSCLIKSGLNVPKKHLAFSTPVARRACKIKKKYFSTPLPTTNKKKPNRLNKVKRRKYEKKGCDTKDISISIPSDLAENVVVVLNKNPFFITKENGERVEMSTKYEYNQESPSQCPHGDLLSEKQERRRKEVTVSNTSCNIASEFEDNTILNCLNILDKPAGKNDSLIDINSSKTLAELRESVLNSIFHPEEPVDEEELVAEVDITFIEFCDCIIENRAYKRWREMCDELDGPHSKKKCYNTAASDKLGKACAYRISSHQ